MNSDKNKDLQSNQALNNKFATGNLRTLIVSSPLAIYVSDMQGVIRFCNTKASEMSGFSIAELEGKTIMSLDNVYVSLEVCQAMWFDMELDNPIQFVSKHVKKNGEVIDVEINSVKIEFEGELFVLGMVRDVSENKRQEKESIRRERLLKTAQSMAKMGNWDFDLVTNTLFWSYEVYQIFEVDPSNFTPNYDSYLSMIHPDDKERVDNLFKESYALFKPYEFTAKIVTSKGNIKFIEGRGDFELDEYGKLIDFNGSVQDVTERINLLNSLQERDRFFEYSVDLFTISDFKGKFLNLNPSWTRELGWSHDELLAKPWLELVHPDDVPRTLTVFDDIKHGKEYFQFENRYLCKDGSYKWIAWNAYPYLKENLVYSVGRNITEQRELENLYHHLFNQMLDGFAMHEMLYDDLGNAVDYRFLSINPSFEKLTGLHANEVVGKTVLQVLPETEITWIDTYAEVVKKGVEIHFENYAASLDKHYEVKAFKTGEHTFATVIIDITERVNAEAKLKEYNEMLQKLAAQVPGVVYKYQLFEDGTSCFPYASPGMIDIYGFTPEEVQTDATPVFGRLHPEDINRVSEAIFESARNQSLFVCEFRVVLPDKGLQWRTSNARPERLPDGSTLWYGIINDITDRKIKEEVIKLSEEKYRIVSDNTFNWEFWEDENGKLVYVSAACLKVTGYSAEEFISNNTLVLQIIHPEDKHIYENHKHLVKSAPSLETCTFRIVTKSGEIKHIQHVCQPALDSDGHYRGIRGTNLDVTESVLQLNKIQSLLTLEEEQTKRMRSFTHIVSHNLRSHTANMQGLLTLISEDFPEYFENNYVQLLHQSAENLNQTLVHLNEVLNVNLIEKEQWVEVNVNQYMAKAMDSVSTLAKFSDVSIQVDIPENINLKTVPAYLESILLNLLTNGIKYASPDRDSYLKISAKIEQEKITITFEDNGIGIDLNRHASAVFGMYKTFHGNKDSKGLGLFMTRNQVEAMGGKIVVQSQVNVGTTFTITLPLIVG